MHIIIILYRQQFSPSFNYSIFQKDIEPTFWQDQKCILNATNLSNHDFLF